MSIEIGQAISIIGGSPILKNVLGHTVDGLKIPRHIDVGNVPGMSGILSKIMGGAGIGSLLQSPLGAALSPLTSALASGQALVASQLGDLGKPLAAALGDLSTSAGMLASLAENLVGFANNPGLPTQFEAIGHMNLAQSLGDALPAAMSEVSVLAPVTSSGLLSDALAPVQQIIAQAVAGTMGIDDAIAATAAIRVGIDAVTHGSTGAITSLQAMALPVSAAQSAVALLFAGSPAMIAAVKAAIRPDQMAAVQAVVDAHAAAIGVSAGSQAVVAQALEDIAAAKAAAAASAAS